MSNTVRHIIGAIVGIAAVPAIVFAVGWAGPPLYEATVIVQVDADAKISAGALLGTGLVLGLLAGSRLSPLAALIPGLALTTLGVLGSLPATMESLYSILGLMRWATGLPVYLVVGGLLLVSALPPSRWRSGRKRESRHSAEWLEHAREPQAAPAAGEYRPARPAQYGQGPASGTGAAPPPPYGAGRPDAQHRQAPPPNSGGHPNTAPGPQGAGGQYQRPQPGAAAGRPPAPGHDPRAQRPPQQPQPQQQPRRPMNDPRQAGEADQRPVEPRPYIPGHDPQRRPGDE